MEQKLELDTMLEHSKESNDARVLKKIIIKITDKFYHLSDQVSALETGRKELAEKYDNLMERVMHQNDGDHPTLSASSRERPLRHKARLCIPTARVAPYRDGRLHDAEVSSRTARRRQTARKSVV